MKNIFVLLCGIFIMAAACVQAQENNDSQGDSAEVFLIDYYVNSDKPDKFVLTFSTSTECVSKVVIQDKYKLDVSLTPCLIHKAELNISGLKFDSTIVPFYVEVTDSMGRISRSELTDLSLPEEYKLESKEGSASVLLNCCLGGIIFGIPAPAYVSANGENYFSLVKEIPIVSIYSSDDTYPVGYFAVDYQHIVNAPVKNFFHFGYKHIMPIPGIEYVSAGLKGFTNFRGYNGLSGEVSAGLFRFYNMFTLYTKYSYSMRPGSSNEQFHTISIGLFASAFTLHLNL